MGRKKSLTEQEVAALLSSDASAAKLAAEFGISISTVYRYLKTGNIFTNTAPKEVLDRAQEVAFHG